MMNDWDMQFYMCLQSLPTSLHVYHESNKIAVVYLLRGFCGVVALPASRLDQASPRK